MPNIEIPKREIAVLTEYAQLLKLHIDPVLSQFSPIGIGGKKRPKEKRLEATRVYNRRKEIEHNLRLESGMFASGNYWELRLIGANTQPGSFYCDKGYWRIFPIRTYDESKRPHLELLASEILPEVFPENQFDVRSLMIPTYGDCSWDCA